MNDLVSGCAQKGSRSGIKSTLTCFFSVELPGIEPAALPGKNSSDLPIRSLWFRFSPAGYLRILLGS
jgi:hypothetical protein